MSVDVVPFPTITISSSLTVMVGGGLLGSVWGDDTNSVATTRDESEDRKLSAVWRVAAKQLDFVGRVCVSKHSRSKSGDEESPAAEGQATGNGTKVARASS